MSKIYKILFAAVVIIGFLLRFIALGDNPPSVNWDEASTGYNAYSILLTGKDEYGNFLPISIRSFDDYKPPLYVYLTVPSVAVFGLTEFAVRFPSAILGTIAVVVMFFFVRELFPSINIDKKNKIALLSAFFLAISPWHLQFSRAAYEGNIGLTFLLLGLWTFLVGLRNKYFLLLSSLFFILSIYSYHSFRLVVPLLLLSLFIIFFKKLILFRNIAIISAVLFFILSIPVYLNFLSSDAGSSSRLSMVSVFASPEITDKSVDRLEYDRKIGYLAGEFFDNRRVFYFLAAAEGYLDHFSPEFLFLKGDGGVQHHPVDFGMLYLFDIPFLLIGAYGLIHRRNKYVGVIFVLLLIAPMASSITTGTPHPVRAIAMLIPLHIIAAVGFILLLDKVMGLRQNVLAKTLIIFMVFGYLLNFSYYLHSYYVHTPREYGYYWQYGHEELFAYLKEREDQYDKITITYEYDQPYVYYLFYNKIEPTWYQKNWDYSGNGVVDRFFRKIGKYEFKEIDYGKDSQSPKTLLVGSPEEIPDSAEIVKTIYFPDGKSAFEIVSL